jgi:hypothetical protein
LVNFLAGYFDHKSYKTITNMEWYLLMTFKANNFFPLSFSAVFSFYDNPPSTKRQRGVGVPVLLSSCELDSEMENKHECFGRKDEK